MGSAGRVASKPGVEIASNTDAVLLLGSDMPLQFFFIPEDAKYIQVDIDGTKFGRRHHVDLSILADAKLTIKKLLESENNSKKQIGMVQHLLTKQTG